MSPMVVPDMPIRLWRMRSSVSRSTFTSCASSRSKCSETEPARLFSMGITAASTSWFARAENTSADSEKGAITASSTSFIAASWLNDPGSPWMAIFIAAPVSPLPDAGFGVGAGFPKFCFLAPYHRLSCGSLEERGPVIESVPQPQVRGDKGEEDGGNHAVHGKEGGSQAAQIARRDEGVFVAEKQGNRRDPQPACGLEMKQPRKPGQQSQHEEVHDARDPEGGRDPQRLGQAVEACGAIVLVVLAGV